MGIFKGSQRLDSAGEITRAEIGVLANLETTDKSNLVSAINEVKNSSSSGSEVANSILDRGTNLPDNVATILYAEFKLLKDAGTLDPNTIYFIPDDPNGNDPTSSIGDLANLTTTNKSNIVNAINEVNAKPSGTNALTLNGKTEVQLNVASAVNATTATTATNSTKLNNKTEAQLSVLTAIQLNGRTESSLSVANATVAETSNNTLKLNDKTEDQLSVAISANTTKLNNKTESQLSVLSAMELNGKVESTLEVASAVTATNATNANIANTATTANNALKLNNKLESALSVANALSANTATTATNATNAVVAESANNALKLNNKLESNLEVASSVTSTTANNALKLNNKTETQLNVANANTSTTSTTANNALKLNNKDENQLSVLDSTLLAGHKIGGVNGIVRFNSSGYLDMANIMFNYGLRDNVMLTTNTTIPMAFTSTGFNSNIIGSKLFFGSSGSTYNTEGYMNIIGTNILSNGVFGLISNSTLIGNGVCSGYSEDVKKELNVQNSFLVNTKLCGSTVNMSYLLGRAFEGRQRPSHSSKNYYKVVSCCAIGEIEWENYNRVGEISASNIYSLGYSGTYTGDYQVQLGNSNASVYGWGAYNVRSDARDKTDITPLTYDAVEFIKNLKPSNYRMDYRKDYFEKLEVTPEIMKTLSEDEKKEVYEDEDTGKQYLDHTLEKDGSKKHTRLHNGFIAQEVKAVADELEFDFAGFQDHKVAGGADVFTLGYEEFIAPIISTIQHLLKEVETLKEEIITLKGGV